jgi:PAS domain S-box-containing protein
VRSERAETALRERDRRVRDVMDNMVDGIITIGQGGTIESFNRTAENIFGYDAAEMIGRNISALMPEPDRGKHDGYLRRHLETGERNILGIGPREVLAQRKDGSTFPVELLTSDMYVDGRRIFIGSVRDISRRKAAETALDESQRTLRAVIDAIPAVINVKDVEGRYMFMNEYQASNHRMDADDAVGLTPGEVHGAEYARQIREMDEKVTRTGKAITNLELELTDIGGKPRLWHATKAPIFDEAGNVASVVTVALDVTDQRKSHEALKRSERQLAEAHRIAGLGSWELDLEAERLEWSEEVFRIFGVADSDFKHTTETFYEHVHPEDVEFVRQLIRAAITEGYPFSVRHRIVRPDGEVRVVQEEAVVIRDEHGHAVRMRGTVQDISERAEAEASLRESRARLAHAQRLSGFGHCIWDEKDRRLAYCSIEVAELFGIPRRMFPQLHADLIDFVDPGDRERVRSATESAKAGEHAYEIEYGIVRPDGGLRSVVEIGEVVLDHSGRIDRTVSTFQDITERKRVVEELRAAKEEAELANRSKSEFLANMSHELRTPLNAIIGFSEMILGTFFGPVGSPKYLEYSQSIKDSGAHLLEIINDILDLSKIETNAVVPDEDDVDVERVVRSCLTLVNDRAVAGRLTVNVNIPGDAPTLRADERMVKQILLNLLSNAVKFTPAGGKITVEVSASTRDGYEFRVTDTGIGIAPEDIPKAMMPFAQVDSGLTRKYEGTGLGLPLTKGLVELHGGSMKITSKVAAGTSVIVRFPPSRVGSSSSAAAKTSSNG